AIPHDGSAWSVASNPLIAEPNQKECSSATARLNSACAAALHDVGKFTVPSFSPSWADTGVVRSSRPTRAPRARARIMDRPPCSRESLASDRLIVLISLSPPTLFTAVALMVRSFPSRSHWPLPRNPHGRDRGRNAIAVPKEG